MQFFESKTWGLKELGRAPFAACPVSACTLTHDRNELPPHTADAVLFHACEKAEKVGGFPELR